MEQNQKGSKSEEEEEERGGNTNSNNLPKKAKKKQRNRQHQQRKKISEIFSIYKSQYSTLSTREIEEFSIRKVFDIKRKPPKLKDSPKTTSSSSSTSSSFSEKGGHHLVVVEGSSSSSSSGSSGGGGVSRRGERKEKEKEKEKEGVTSVISENPVFQKMVSSMGTIGKTYLLEILFLVYSWKTKFSVDEILKSTLEQINLNFELKLLRKNKLFSTTRLVYDIREFGGNYVFCYTVLGIISQIEKNRDSEMISSFAKDEVFDNLVILSLKYFRNEVDLSFKNAGNQGVKALEREKKIVCNMYAKIIGVLSSVCFSKVYTRFISEIRKTLKMKNKQSKKKRCATIVRGLTEIRLNIRTKESLGEVIDFLEKLLEVFMEREKRKSIAQAVCESMSVVFASLSLADFSSEVNYSRFYSVTRKYFDFSGTYKYSKDQFSTPLKCSSLALCSRSYFIQNYWNILNVLLRQFQNDKKKMGKIRIVTIDCIIHLVGHYLNIAKVPNSDIKETVVFERLLKLSQSLFSGKKGINIYNPHLYFVIADLIVMIANTYTEFAVKNFVLVGFEDNIVSDNTLIAIRSFLALADQGDINNIVGKIRKDRVRIDKVPSWVTNLLHRTNRLTAHSRGFGDSKAVKSPFTSKSPSIASDAFFTLGSYVNAPISKYFDVSRLNIMTIAKFSEALGKNLGKVIIHCNRLVGGYSFWESSPITYLKPNWKDKHDGVLKVFKNAIECLPRIVPQDITIKELARMICNCTLHRDPKIQKVSWNVCSEILDFQSIPREFLIDAFSRLVLDLPVTFDLYKIISRFVILLKRWLTLLVETSGRKKTYSPTVFCANKTRRVPRSFNVVNILVVDVVGLICLCHSDLRLRGLSVKIFKIISSIYNMFSNRKTCSVQTIFVQSGMDIIKEIQGKKSFLGIEDFLENSTGDQYSLFLNRLGKILSKNCQKTVDLAMKVFVQRIVALHSNFEVNLKEKEKLKTRIFIKSFKLWKFILPFAVSLSCKYVQKETEIPRTLIKMNDTTPSEVQKTDIFSIVLPFIKSNVEVQKESVIEILGYSNEDMLGVLFENLKPHEEEYMKKRKRLELRVSISRIYSSLARYVSKDCFSIRSIKEKFESFILNTFQFVKKTGVYELQELKHNFFVVIEYVARKCFYSNSKISIKIREKLIQYIFGYTAVSKPLKKDINKYWSGNRTKHEPASNRHRGVDKYLEKQACFALSSLFLGIIFDNNDYQAIYESNNRKRTGKGSLATTIFRWCEDQIQSNQRKHVAQSILEAILDQHTDLVEFYLDQCFYKSSPVSDCYFIAFVRVFKKREVKYMIHSLISVVVYESISSSKLIRNFALSILPRLIGMNSQYFLTSGLQEFYDEQFHSICEEISKKYSLYSKKIVHYLVSKIFYVPVKKQKKLISSLGHWVKTVVLSGNVKKANGKFKLSPAKKNGSVKEYVFLESLFELTSRFGSIFPEESKNFWHHLSKAHENNIPEIVQFLLNKGLYMTEIKSSNEDFLEKFRTCQQIISYCGMTDRKKTMEYLVRVLKDNRDQTEVCQNDSPIEFTEDFRKSKKSDAKTPSSVSSIALVIMVEFSYEFADSFAGNVPLVLLNCLLRFDHPNEMIFSSAKIIVMNIIYCSISKKLNLSKFEDIEKFEICKNLLKDLSTSNNLFFTPGLVWEKRREALRSSSEFSVGGSLKNTLSDFLVGIKSLFSKRFDNFVENFGDECLYWGQNSSYFHNVVRSFQFFRITKPRMKYSRLLKIIRVIEKYLQGFVYFSTKINEISTGDGRSFQRNGGNLKALESRCHKCLPILQEIFFTVEEMIKSSDYQLIIRFPHWIWISISFLYSNMNSLYVIGLKLFSIIVDKINFKDDGVFKYFFQSFQPIEKFEGIDYLIFKGLLYPSSVNISVKILYKLIKVTFFQKDNGFRGQKKEHLVMKIIGLLPFLCCHISSSFSEKIGKVCKKIVKDLAIICEKENFENLSKVFVNYHSGKYRNAEKFLVDLRVPMAYLLRKCNDPIVHFLEYLLRTEVPGYRKVVLKILHTLLPNDLQNVDKDFIPLLVKLTSDPHVSEDATRVLGVIVSGADKWKEKKTGRTISKRISLLSSVVGMGTKNDTMAMITKLLQLTKRSKALAKKKKKKIGLQRLEKELMTKKFVNQDGEGKKDRMYVRGIEEGIFTIDETNKHMDDFEKYVMGVLTPNHNQESKKM